MTTTVEQLLTTEGLAKLLGHSADWWAREARAKRVPHVRIGRKIRFTAVHVAQIVAANEVQPQVKSAPSPPAGEPTKPAASPMGLTPRSAAAARRRAGKSAA